MGVAVSTRILLDCLTDDQNLHQRYHQKVLTKIEKARSDLSQQFGNQQSIKHQRHLLVPAARFRSGGHQNSRCICTQTHDAAVADRLVAQRMCGGFEKGCAQIGIKPSSAAQTMSSCEWVSPRGGFDTGSALQAARVLPYGARTCHWPSRPRAQGGGFFSSNRSVLTGSSAATLFTVNF
jgi:hypothetical protein